MREKSLISVVQKNLDFQALKELEKEKKLKNHTGENHIIKIQFKNKVLLETIIRRT